MVLAHRAAHEVSDGDGSCRRMDEGWTVARERFQKEAMTWDEKMAFSQCLISEFANDWNEFWGENSSMGLKSHRLRIHNDF